MNGVRRLLSSHGAVQPPACVRRQCNTGNASARSASPPEGVSVGLADHGITYSEAEPILLRGGESSVAGAATIFVVADSKGLSVRWKRQGGEVFFAPATSVCAGSLVDAARLVANADARVVQLTILDPGFRVYVDGQQLLRFRSPVVVRPFHKVTFAKDTTVYTIVPTSPPAKVPYGGGLPCSEPPAMHVRLAVSSVQPPFPLSRKPSPRVQRPQETTSYSLSDTSSCCTTGADASAPPEMSDSWVTGKMILPPGPDESCVVRTHNSANLRGSTLLYQHQQQPQRQRSQIGESCASRLLHTAVRRFLPVDDKTTTSIAAGCETTGALLRCGSLLETDTGVTDLLPAASLDKDRHTSDVMESTMAVHREAADTKEERAFVEAQHPGDDAHSDKEYLSSGTANGSFTEVEQRQQCQQVSVHPRFRQLITTFALRQVRWVASPDWSALTAHGSDFGGADGSSTSTSNAAEHAFAAALMSRRWWRSQSEGFNAQQQQQQQRSQQNRNELMGGNNSLVQAARVPPVNSASASVVNGSSCSGAMGNTNSRSVDARGERRVMSNTSSGRVFLEDSLYRVEGSSDDSHTNSNSLTPLNAKLKLKQRMMVVPFVVEIFGGTHRYRPLMYVPAISESQRSSNDGERSDTARAQQSCSDLLRQMIQEGEEGPWAYPPAADELVTPHTECVLRKAMRHVPERTTAAKSASFLHDALRRSYDAATDRFTYLASPDLPDLLYNAFITVTAEVAANLEQDRPVRRLRSPLICAGDVFGSFKDVLVLLGSVAHFTHWSMMHLPLVLLGNYVDYGWHSVEVVLLLCSWACLQPTKVHLLRGPHEDPHVNGSYVTLGKRCLLYKCRQRFGPKKGVALWKRMNWLFALLPVAAVVDGSVFVVHGGVPQLLPSPAANAGKLKDGSKSGSAGHRLPRGTTGGEALYSNTSGVPTPTSPVTASASTVSSHYADMQWSAAASAKSRSSRNSWRPPSAVQIFPQTKVSHREVRNRKDNAQRQSLRTTHVDRGLQADRRNSFAADINCFPAAAGVGRPVPELGAVEERIVGPQTTSIASAVLTNLQRDDAIAWEAPSFVSSLTSCVGSNKSSAGRRITTDLSPRRAAPPFSVCLDEGIECITDFIASPAVQTTPLYAPLIAPPTKNFSFFDSIYANQDHHVNYNGPRTPLLDRNNGDTAGVAQTNDTPSVLVFDTKLPHAAPVEAPANQSGTPTSSLPPPATAAPPATTAAATNATESDVAHKTTTSSSNSSTPSSPNTSTALQMPRDTPTEEDFEQLLFATNMHGYSFRTMQPGNLLCDGNADTTETSPAKDSEARRRRLVRELLWNRPRSTAARMFEAAEVFKTVDGELQPSWWSPHEVQCCRVHCCAAPPAAAGHRCCHIFGSWGLVRFLDRFRFSLIVRGAPEDTSEMYGALLAEEGRLLSLLTCTRIQKRRMQAAACVLQPTSLQLATWGTQTLADSRGQVSLSKLSGAHRPCEERKAFGRFLDEQVRVRMEDHEQVGLHNRWGIASAYDEFKRQRALERRLEHDFQPVKVKF